ncbi:MAG: NAD(+)/NADH kinase, partial [Candidatus Omnitrophota bacterium]
MKIPRILVVYKRSALSVAGKWSKHLCQIEQFKSNHAAHLKSLNNIESILRKNAIPFDKHARAPHLNYSEYNLIITVGGDGTVLECARAMRNKQLLLAVNSDPCWSVGQFCQSNSFTFESLLKKFLSGKANLLRLYKLKVVIKKNNKLFRKIECLNDVLICHANPASMSRYRISIASNNEDQRASGI